LRRNKQLRNNKVTTYEIKQMTFSHSMSSSPSFSSLESSSPPQTPPLIKIQNDDDMIMTPVPSSKLASSLMISTLPASTSTSTSILYEVKLLLNLAIPTMAIDSIGFFPDFLSSSYVGRKFGYESLAAITMALLTANLSLLCVLDGIAMAANTLQPQAFAQGNYRQVGVISIQGFVLCIAFLTPINLILWFFMKDILVHGMGQDEVLSTEAWDWYRVFSLSLPFYALSMVINKFLVSQMITWPNLVIVAFCAFVIFPIALRTMCTAYGFLGSAMAFVAFKGSESFLLLVFVGCRRPHTAGTWPGLSATREAMSWETCREYIVSIRTICCCPTEWQFPCCACLECLGLASPVLTLHFQCKRFHASF
jgi:MatE